MFKFVSILTVSLMFAPLNGFAATGTASFAGTITSTCILTSGTPGVIAPNADYTGLSSTNAGGSVSTVTALSTGAAFKVSTDAPTGVTADTLTSSYSLSGSTTSGSVSGSTLTTLNPGSTAVAVNMSAVKTSGHFAAGAYTGLVTVRCE